MGWERFDRGTKAPLGVAVARKELLVHRTRAELAVDYPELAAASRFGAWLSIPLLRRGQDDRGDRALVRGRAHLPPGGSREYVESLARQTGLALDRTLLLEDEQRARARAEQLASDLSRLHAFATALGAATSTSEVGTLVCEQVKSMLGASACAVYVPFESDQFQLLHGTGSLFRGHRPDARRPRVAGLPRRCAQPPEQPVAGDRRRLERRGALRSAADAQRARAVAVVPLAVGGQPSGLLVCVVLDGRVPGGERETAPGDDGAAGDAAARARAAARERAGGAARGADRRAADAHAPTRWRSG